MNQKSTTQAVFILLSEREMCYSCSSAGSCLGSLLGAFSIELQGKVWACCRVKKAEDSENEGAVYFAR